MSQSTIDLQTQVKDLLDELVDYNTKPTKANSKRVRTKLGAIKKQTASIRQELVALDKAGY